MPLLIALLTIFGGFVVGSYVGSGAVTVIALVFTAPGFIYEKLLSDKRASKPGMFLVDLAFWSVVFGILHLCGKLTVLNVTLGLAASFVIGIIGAVCYYFFGLDERRTGPDRNCDRCGKPFSAQYYVDEALCRRCRNAYERAVESEIRRLPQNKKCDKCTGSGRIKGHRCAGCNGRGSVAIPEYLLIKEATSALRHNSEWGKFACRYKGVDD